MENSSAREDTSTARASDPSSAEAARRSLFHEWFVEHNPLYLLSAALVLGGVWLLARDMGRHGALGGMGITLITELYAGALIAGAALLRKLGLRRPAVMLGLLAAVYQCDVTLHVETCSFLGALGRAGAAAWVVLFVVKLHALAAALELRPSRSALAVPVIAALGLAVLPQIFQRIAPDARTPLVAIWAFAVGASALWTTRTIESAIGYDVRGRRAIRGTWILWAAGLLFHIGYWVAELGVELVGLAPVALLLGTRGCRTERDVWTVVAATLVAVWLVAPASLSLTAVMAAVVLVLRAVRTPTVRDRAAERAAAPPYRGASASDEPASGSVIATFERADPHAMQRLLVGAVASLHLAAWTAGMQRGAGWPEHQLALDLALTIAALLATHRWRRPAPLAPVVAVYGHLLIQRGWVTVPRGAGQWGATLVGLGFAILVAALAATWAITVRREPAAVPAPLLDPPPR